MDDLTTDWADTKWVARATGIPEGTWRYWKSVGRGPRCYVIGGKLVRYRKDEVMAWMTAQAVEPRPAAS